MADWASLSREELARALYARNAPGSRAALQDACVGIAGCGGLGSNIAVMLARSGVGKLALADYDVVELSNLNRQQYTLRQVGQPKVSALKELLLGINPYIDVAAYYGRVEECNCVELFGDCAVVCEAFDDPLGKAMLVDALLSGSMRVRLVCASGMAGLGSCNDIVTRRLGTRLILCGDGRSEDNEGKGMMAPRVTVCAGHQANAALNILLAGCDGD